MADIILASWFYTLNNEKIKFNWFCFEYALKLYDYMKDSRKSRKWISGMSDLQLAQFCAYFSKRMKKSVDDRLAGLTDATECEEEYISDFCHTNTHCQNLAIAEEACVAWEMLLSVCVTCPTRCISERYMYCEFFDRMKRGGYFS